MPPLHLRQEFPTLKAFKEALHAWAIESHFEPRILKSDTGRVRVGCKRDPNCPFVIRCNWERKLGRPQLARVTVLKEKHTCLDGVEWVATGAVGAAVGAAGNKGALQHGPGAGAGGIGGPPPALSESMSNPGQMGGVEMRQDEGGNIVGGVRVIGPVDGGAGTAGHVVPVLPKVQRNSASRLPFLLEILPQLMDISKETTPVEIRECLLRKYGAEVHLQQCRRAKTEILKKLAATREERVGGALGPAPGQELRPQQSMDGLGSESANDASQQLFGDMNNAPNPNPHQFTLHTASGVVVPAVPEGPTAALREVGEAPVRCPYCINHRWMRSIKDAVEHMSMHVVV